MPTVPPVAPWVFLDYVEANGTNQISEWLRGISLAGRVALESHLDTIRPKTSLGRPETGKLSGDCDGLFEFRFSADNIQYRPLFVYGKENRQITILAGATKTGGRKDIQWHPPDVCQTARRRIRYLEHGQARRVPHVRI